MFPKYLKHHKCPSYMSSLTLVGVKGQQELLNIRTRTWQDINLQSWWPFKQKGRKFGFLPRLQDSESEISSEICSALCLPVIWALYLWAEAQTREMPALETEVPEEVPRRGTLRVFRTWNRVEREPPDNSQVCFRPWRGPCAFVTPNSQQPRRADCCFHFTDEDTKAVSAKVENGTLFF